MERSHCSHHHLVVDIPERWTAEALLITELIAPQSKSYSQTEDGGPSESLHRASSIPFSHTPLWWFSPVQSILRSMHEYFTHSRFPLGGCCHERQLEARALWDIYICKQPNSPAHKFHPQALQLVLAPM